MINLITEKPIWKSAVTYRPTSLTSVRIMWNREHELFKNFIVSVKNGQTIVAIKTTANTHYIFNGLSSSTLYTFVVKANDIDGKSGGISTVTMSCMFYFAH